MPHCAGAAGCAHVIVNGCGVAGAAGFTVGAGVGVTVEAGAGIVAPVGGAGRSTATGGAARMLRAMFSTCSAV